MFTCEGADYRVTFCPTAGTFSTIELGGQLRSTDRLVSSNGAFTLGFYGEKYEFLGIWYSNDEKKKVWVTDLSKLIVSTSSAHVLSIDPNTGNLIITVGKTTLWIITDVHSGPNVMATLGDDGHLRLINKNNGTILWQTYFHLIIPYGHTTKTLLWVPLVAVIVIILLIILCCMYYKKRKLGREGEKQEIEMETQDICIKELVLKANNIRLFDYDAILVATSSFSDKNKLGEGGFGPVYKGTFDGEEMAVKKLKPTSAQGSKEFETEIIAIVTAKHTCLLEVRGCCIRGSELILVYEFMENKSSDYHLYDEATRMELRWPTRKNIIQMVAKGLVYLHEDLNKQVIHRDLKASNILLDQNMNAKISDFGLAKFLGLNETVASTKTLDGTVPYMAPEYRTNRTFSTKYDIFSFGVLMLEIASGICAVRTSFPENTGSLVGYAWHLWEKREKSKLKDPLLQDEDVDDEVSRIIDISYLCIQEKPEDRPKTSTILQLLTSDVLVPEPIFPSCLGGTPAQSSSLLDMIRGMHSSIMSDVYSLMGIPN